MHGKDVLRRLCYVLFTCATAYVLRRRNYVLCAMSHVLRRMCYVACAMILDSSDCMKNNVGSDLYNMCENKQARKEHCRILDVAQGRFSSIIGTVQLAILWMSP